MREKIGALLPQSTISVSLNIDGRPEEEGEEDVS
jgi:hypothetical protein